MIPDTVRQRGSSGTINKAGVAIDRKERLSIRVARADLKARCIAGIVDLETKFNSQTVGKIIVTERCREKQQRIGVRPGGAGSADDRGNIKRAVERTGIQIGNRWIIDKFSIDTVKAAVAEITVKVPEAEQRRRIVDQLIIDHVHIEVELLELFLCQIGRAAPIRQLIVLRILFKHFGLTDIVYVSIVDVVGDVPRLILIGVIGGIVDVGV